MDWKIYLTWTEEFKGYYWERKENCVCNSKLDDDQEYAEDLLTYDELKYLEQHNKKARKFGGYPIRIVAERFKLVELTDEDLTALEQEILDDDENDLFNELEENYRNEYYGGLYYIDGELYDYATNGKLCHCESEGMISPVGYDPNDDDSDDCYVHLTLSTTK